MDYPGKVITKTQVTPTQTSASGNWTLDDQAAAIKNNNWPVALVPNPISKSLRFNSADSAYLNRTPASASNRKTWTWSGWFKTVAQGGTYTIISTGSSGNYTQVLLTGSQLSASAQTSSSYTLIQNSSALFRDPSAWYHFVWAVDTTQATAANRSKMYINGTQIAIDGSPTYPSQNADLWVNAAAAHFMGQSFASSNYFSGYLTEINFIDGQALTPSSFGMTNPQTGQWIPLKYSGTYGTNGFYLNFKDATSTTTLGYDYSGNANNWTTNNFSVTAGAGNDSLTDVPTPWIAYNTTGDVGGVIRGNYCTLNALYTYPSASSTLSNGNLDIANVNITDGARQGTLGVTSGKFYFEMLVTATTASGQHFAGWQVAVPGDVARRGTYRSSGTIYDFSGGTTSGSTYTTNDVIGCAVDVDAGKVWFAKNNTWQNSGNPSAGTNEAFTFTAGTQVFPVIAFDSAAGTAVATATANFGQRPFAYTPPTGFRSLCTTNLPATAIGFGLTNQGDDYFNAVLWTGDGASSRNITGVGFQPDWVWLKSRSNATVHRIFDSVRGATKTISSNLTDAESTEAQQLTAFISDGFSLGSDVGTNGSARTFVAWNWKASGSTVSNTAGTITSTVSANTTAGFSVVTFTSPSSGNFSVGHGLGVAPKMIITKRRDSTSQWWVWHISLGDNTTDYLSLNTTNAETSATNMWGTVGRDSSVMGYNSGVSVVGGSTQVAYCFAAVPGYSAFGSYTGNGSADGPFIYTGFRPRYVMFKCSNSTESGNANWAIIDTSRSPYNFALQRLWADLSNAEDNNAAYALDILSNGFKLRNGDANYGQNTNGNTYIYACFAEFPFQFANAR